MNEDLRLTGQCPRVSICVSNRQRRNSGWTGSHPRLAIGDTDSLGQISNNEHLRLHAHHGLDIQAAVGPCRTVAVQEKAWTNQVKVKLGVLENGSRIGQVKQRRPQPSSARCLNRIQESPSLLIGKHTTFRAGRALAHSEVRGNTIHPNPLEVGNPIEKALPVWQRHAQAL